MSNFSFSHSVFKRLVFLGRQKVSLCSKGLSTGLTRGEMHAYVSSCCDMTEMMLKLFYNTIQFINHSFPGEDNSIAHQGRTSSFSIPTPLPVSIPSVLPSQVVPTLPAKTGVVIPQSPPLAGPSTTPNHPTPYNNHHTPKPASVVNPVSSTQRFNPAKSHSSKSSGNTGSLATNVVPTAGNPGQLSQQQTGTV